jgi:hypothetical protein
MAARKTLSTPSSWSSEQVTRDGTVCKAEDLKAGNKIRVTTKKDDRHIATGIESLDKHAEFAKCSS